MNTEMGVVIYMYLKHSPDYMDSKYILVHGQTKLLRFKCFCLYTTFGIFSHTHDKEEVWPDETLPMLSQSEVVYAHQVFYL